MNQTFAQRKMNVFDFTLICAFIQLGYQNPLSSWTLKPNVLVVEVNGALSQQALKCLHSAEEVMRGDDKDILWKKNGAEEAQRGNSYLVQLEESLGGGNYSCYSKDGSLLNHTLVLIQEDNRNSDERKILVKSDLGDYLKCSTKNFEGAFHCSWTWDTLRVGKVELIMAKRVRSCSVDTSGHHSACNFSCSEDGTGHGISCVDEQYCPYAEENSRINITVYVRTDDFLVESYEKHFFLSEIVKPDKVKIRRVNTTTIEWTYPSSWSSPYSYFPLTFQVLERGCKTCDKPCNESKNIMVHSLSTCQFEVKHKSRTVCVRAKDALCHSQWSEWSHLSIE
nr:interleukin-12 subunit beta-like [Nerophis lumbriciformis]